MNDHQLDKLVRTINPATFSMAAHGLGCRVVCSGTDHVALYKPRMLDRLRGHKDEVHYFVKNLSTPLVIDSWEFNWSEGTSAVTLDFAATFEIQANGDEQAHKLVKALHCVEGPSTALYGLIHHYLHQVMVHQLRECISQNRNLLTIFRSSNVGIGESELLNQEVTSSVSAALGSLPFRIGFRLRNAPPMQIEVTQVDTFTLADSTAPRKANTTALLELDSYQTYKKTGLETEPGIRDAIRQSITQAVKRHLFAQRYYTVVEKFSEGDDSIKSRMEKHIREDAHKIGYRLNMFQTLPDIAALELLDRVRVELPAEEFKYRPKDAMGYIQMQVAFFAKGREFNRLDRLIGADEADIPGRLRREAHQICLDVIQTISRKEFNLSFKDKIVPELTSAIVKGFRRYGLDVDIINITPAPTEEAERYVAIRGQTVAFKVEISPQADGGHGDIVTFEGGIEVTGIAEDGWERFESKDFGFRSDSIWTAPKLWQRAEAKGIVIPRDSGATDPDRHAVAIELELQEIRARVVSTLTEALSKEAGLADRTSTRSGSEELASKIGQLAREAVQSEFGLIVSIRGIMRADTDSEKTVQARRSAGHELLRERALLDKEFELRKTRTSNDASIKRLEELHDMELSLLTYSSDPKQDLVRIENKIRQEMGESNDNFRVTSNNAMQMLTRKQDRDAGKRLTLDEKAVTDGPPSKPALKGPDSSS